MLLVVNSFSVTLSESFSWFKFSISIKSTLLTKLLLSNLTIKVLFFLILFFPNLTIDWFTFLSSMYIQISSSKVLTVEGGPNISKMSFLLLLPIVILSFFLSKFTNPWVISNCLGEQLETASISKKKTIFFIWI